MGGSFGPPVIFEDVLVVFETEKAIRVRFAGGSERWLPKSLVHEDSEVWDEENAGPGVLKLPLWFVEKEGLEDIADG
mgnify:FL=1